MSSTEVAKIAKSVTVAIKTPDERGSGAIIDRTGNTYTLLTAAHVVKTASQSDREVRTLLKLLFNLAALNRATSKLLQLLKKRATRKAH